MKRTMKRTLSLLLACILLLGSFAAGTTASAEDVTYQTGDVIEFGSYPQSRVTDEETLAALNDLQLEWKSYGYYGYADSSLMDETGMKQIPYNYMKYADVSLDSVRYRAVYFTKYRPYQANGKWDKYESQFGNGYTKNCTYWFRFEPLRWRILSAQEQLVISESVIDAQPYSNTCFYNAEDGKEYKDYTCTVDYRNYACSSIRAFLNDRTQENSFAGLAFTEDEWGKIIETHLDNRDDAQQRDKSGEDTDDKVFLPSVDFMNDTTYWAGQNASVQEKYAARKAFATEYARCQGVGTSLSAPEEAGYLLRTINSSINTSPSDWEKTVYAVSTSGEVSAFVSALCSLTGTRPVMRIDFSLLTPEKDVLVGGHCGDNLTWCFSNGDLLIAGFGAMKEYGSAQACPWDALRSRIRSVTVQDDVNSTGVSSISAYAFKDCPNLTEVYLNCVRKIGKQAFVGDDKLHSVTAFAEVLMPNNAFPAGKADLRFYCQSQSVQQTVQALGYAGVLMTAENRILFIPGSITVNEETPFVHLEQWISFFANAQWVHFDNVVFAGVSPSTAAARNRSFTDADAAELTLTDFYFSKFTLQSTIGSLTMQSVLKGLQDEACAAFFHDPTFGEHIEFGSYPQTEVKDVTLTDALNAAVKKWTSYGYYSGDETIGSMQPGDFMQYADVTYNGVQYRGVKITKLRPYEATFWAAIDETKYASLKGSREYCYTFGTYWFRYEPLSWRVLDAEDGLLLCENVIDYQPFQNEFWGYNDSDYSERGLPFPSDYSGSSIRDWLNESFLDTAFSELERACIVPSLNETPDTKASAQYSNYSLDSVFLLSNEEIHNPAYGFSCANTADPARATDEITDRWTDYSKSQGVYKAKTYAKDMFLWLRTPDTAWSVSFQNHHGAFGVYDCTYRCNGIRPAMRIDPALLTELPDDPPVEPQNPLSGTCGENVQWTFDEESGVLSLSGTGAMNSLDSFEEYGYSIWQDDIQFVAAADGVTSIGAHAFEGCPILEEVILGEDVTAIGEAAFADCPRLMNVTLLSQTISADNAFSADRIDWTLIFDEANQDALCFAKTRGIGCVPVSFKDGVLSFGGTITVHDGFAYTYLPMFVQRYGSAQKVYFNRLVFADVKADSVTPQDFTSAYFDSLVMQYVEVTLFYIAPDGEQTEVTYDRMIELLQSGDYSAFKLRVTSTNGDGEEMTREEIIEQKLEEIFPFVPKRVLKLISKAINFIVGIFKKK